MKKCIQKLSLSQLLEVWEMTTNCNEPEIPMVRGWIMDEIERRVPERFNAWLNLIYPDDNYLRTIVKANHTCLDCERLCNGCDGLESCYTGCAMKRAIKEV